MKKIKSDEALECGLVIGTIVTRLENDNIITFTNDFSYDDEFITLSKYLIEDWVGGICNHNYFSEFVESELRLIESDYKNKNYGGILELLFKGGF